jgi:hypothetical protein
MTTETATTQTKPDSGALRSEIEAVRAAFHTLLDSLSSDDWKKKSANPAWTVGQLMWHIGRGAAFSNEAIGYCRKGRGPNPPAFLIAPGNVLLTKFGSRGASPDSVRRKFDAETDALLTALDGIADDEWSKSARIYGTDYTIASVFEDVKNHFREHEEDILKGLGRR